MSRTYSKLTNRQQKHPKVHFQQYLYHADEPPEYVSTNLPAELLENSESMRQSILYHAQGMRNQ